MTSRFLADENFPFPTVRASRDVGHDIACVAELAASIDDEQVLNMALADKRVLLTCDKDFGTLVFHQSQDASCGVLLVRLSTTNLSEFTTRVVAALDGDVEWAGRFSVMSNTGIRRRPLPRQ